MSATAFSEQFVVHKVDRVVFFERRQSDFIRVMILTGLKVLELIRIQERVEDLGGIAIRAQRLDVLDKALIIRISFQENPVERSDVFFDNAAVAGGRKLRMSFPMKSRSHVPPA